jgi:uncharacterized protein YgbK (DUF1537 family)
MSLTFEKVKEIAEEFGLYMYTRDNGKKTEFSFENRKLDTGKRNVLTEVAPLRDGGVRGYIYVNHLREFDDHLQKTKMGHIPIGQMNEAQLREVLAKSVVHYQ